MQVLKYEPGFRLIKMNKKAKRNLLIFVILSAAISFLIAVGLPGLTLSEGMPLPDLQHGNGTLIIADPKTDMDIVGSISDVSIFLILLAIGFFIFCYRVFRRMNWREWQFIVPIFLSALAISGTIFVLFLFLPKVSIPAMHGTTLPLTAKPLRSPLGPVPVILLWIMGFILTGLAILLIFRIIFAKKRSDVSIHLMELEALKAKEALQHGQDFTDVITRYYQQMCQTLKREKNIEREESMTVEEFEKLLETAGAPHESVRKLTRLFEAVRYGNRKPDSADTQIAIQCFEEIIQCCRKESGGDGYEKI